LHMLKPAAPDPAKLDVRDHRLALAIHRTVLHRWMSLEYLLDAVSGRPLHRMEPTMRAVLLAGAAQLLFMERLPTHAVVDESVELAKKLVRPGAGGLTNAVLRKIAALVGARDDATPWTPARDRLPLGDGTLTLTDDLLP